MPQNHSTTSLLLLLAFGLCLGACILGNSSWVKLAAKIESGQETIFFTELTEFDWDVVCVLPPYSLDAGGKYGRLNKFIPYDLGKFKK